MGMPPAVGWWAAAWQEVEKAAEWPMALMHHDTPLASLPTCFPALLQMRRWQTQRRPVALARVWQACCVAGPPVRPGQSTSDQLSLYGLVFQLCNGCATVAAVCKLCSHKS